MRGIPTAASDPILLSQTVTPQVLPVMSFRAVRSNEEHFGTQRRVMMNPTVLKSMKLFAGDLVLVLSERPNEVHSQV